MILLPNQSTALSLHFADKRGAQILFSGSPVAADLCVLLIIVTRSRLVGQLRRLKATKLDHCHIGCESYPQHKWLSAGLIDKLPLHFISQTDRA